MDATQNKLQFVALFPDFFQIWRDFSEIILGWINCFFFEDFLRVFYLTHLFLVFYRG